MAAFPKTVDEWFVEKASIRTMTDAEILARYEDYKIERLAVEHAWKAVEHLEPEHPDRAAVADRDFIARNGFYWFGDEARAIRVKSMSFKEQFAIAMGLGLMDQQDLS